MPPKRDNKRPPAPLNPPPAKKRKNAPSALGASPPHALPQSVISPALDFNQGVLRIIEKCRDRHPGWFASPDSLNPEEAIVLLKIVAMFHLGLSKPDEATYDSHVQQPALKEAIQHAYTQGLFDDLRNHPLMPYATHESTPLGGGQIRPSDGNNSLQSAFEQPYIGATPKLFLQTLNHERESAGRPIDQKPYNWSISVIQSSGMGKSRMVDETSNLIFTIPVNIREKLPDEQQTYPLSDSPVREYFEDHEKKSDTQLQAEYAILLLVLFDKTVDVIRSKGRLQGRTGRGLACAFAEYLKQGGSEEEVGANRRVFFDAVVQEANEHRSRLDSPGQARVKTLTKKLKESCKKLVAAISPNHITNTNACLVYFDEAHRLTETTGINNMERTLTPYHNLGKRFAPANVLHPSSRVFKGRRLIAPFTELPFDVFKAEVLNDKKELTLPVVCSTEVTAAFGRAMWHVHHRNRLEEDVFEFAMQKLTAGAPPDQQFTPSLAALAVRVGINFDVTTQASRALESKLV
ncbi:hypothetical protein FRC06_004663, partial [Ceratobasidium sp. 370]